MSNRSIFLLLFCTQITTSIWNSDLPRSLAYDICEKFIYSKFVRESNSTNEIRHLKSQSPWVRVSDISYNFLPEPLGFAWIRNPESVDLTHQNKSCLENWRITYNEKVAACNKEAEENIYYDNPSCEWRREYGDDCEVNKPRFTCADLIACGQFIDKADVIFPDGRSLDSIQWNCSADYFCCTSGCCPYPTAPPTSPTTPTSTTASSTPEMESDRNISTILLKVGIALSLLFTLIVFILRCYGYRNKSQEAGPIPDRKQYDLAFPSHKNDDVRNLPPPLNVV